MKRLQAFSIALFWITWLITGPIAIANGQDLNIAYTKSTKNPKLEGVLERIATKWSAGERALAKTTAQSYRSPVSMSGAVTVLLVPFPGKGAESIDRMTLDALGVEVMAQSNRFLRVRVPVENIETLSQSEGISFIQFPKRPHSHAVISEGLSAIGVQNLHTQGIRGAGVKVAVIDGGFEGLQEAAGAGDTPGRWKYKDFTGEGIYTGNKHGTACAEIVYDMAPDAELIIYKVGDLVDLENAKDDAIASGAGIITHSMSWLGSGFGDGLGDACDIVNDAFAKGVLWVNSAGNYAQRQYVGQFNDPDSDRWHNFSGDDEVLVLLDTKIEDEIEIWLTWNEWPHTSQDYDLALVVVGADGKVSIVEESDTVQRLFSPPIEHIVYKVNDTRKYGISVWKSPTARSSLLKVISQNHNIEAYASVSGSIGSPADAKETVSVGAMAYSRWQTGPVQDFSSRGPTVDGRIKPDLIAPDGVTTNSYGNRGFFGTSAAAPHVAGVAALIKGSDPITFTVSKLRQTLFDATRDMGEPGKDNVYGFGRLDASLLKLTQATPTLQVSATQINFGQMNPGETGARDLIISNTGRATLILSNFEVTAPDFTVARSQASVRYVHFGQVTDVRNWTFGTQWQIKNGIFVATGEADRSFSATHPLRFGSVLDISVSTIWMEGISNNAYGIYFRSTNEGAYYFGISGDGSYIVGKYKQEWLPDLVPWTRNSNINTKGTNRLRVVTNGDILTFYINGVRVNEVVDQDFKDGFVSLRVDAAQTISFDDLVIVDSPLLPPVHIAPSASTTLKLAATMFSPGEKVGQLKITTNDPARTTLLVSLAAAGKAPDVPAISVSQTKLDFGSLTIGQSKSLTFRITNSGNAILSVSGIVLSDPQFTSNASSFTLAPGASRDVAITFKPTLAGAKSATLIISSNAPGTPALSIAITGTGLTPPPLVPGEGPVGPMALDLDRTLGDQGKRTGLYPKSGDTITVDLVATEGARGLSGFEATLSFDPVQLQYISFGLADLFAGGVRIETLGNGTIQISAVFFGATTTTKSAGTLGQFTFKVQPGYTGETFIRITSGSFAFGETPQPQNIGSGGSIVAIGGKEPSKPTPDFDGDGIVDFKDFLMFATVFGTKDGDVLYKSKFDLDQNGDIGFSDFLIFAQAFGKPVTSR